MARVACSESAGGRCREDLMHAFDSELLAVGVHRLGDAVGVEHNHVPGCLAGRCGF